MNKLFFSIFSAAASSTVHAHPADAAAGGWAALLSHLAGHPEALFAVGSLAGIAVLMRRRPGNKR